ncbi:MAG TPA: fasciclin domain-containing protein [Deltaproteobacteria bacterium]|nr:fasciclin domain-containing protein [Deltaproteobacteria bacterium]HPR53434.1 fasciclin domain-containing protein [Deltaproteobacteria bacterium]
MNEFMKCVVMWTVTALVIFLLVSLGYTGQPEEHDLLDTINANGSLRILARAIEETGTDGILKNDGPFTIFAPDDEAFRKLPPEMFTTLFNPDNADQLASIISIHIIPERLMASDIAAMDSILMSNGDTLSVNSNNRGILVNDALIIEPDILCPNGVIHIIDTTLTPAE